MSTQEIRPTTACTIDVVIPVLNEAHVLEKSVQTVRQFLQKHLIDRSRVVIVDNGSTDGTDTLVLCTLFRRGADVRCAVPGCRVRQRSFATWMWIFRLSWKRSR